MTLYYRVLDKKRAVGLSLEWMLWPVGNTVDFEAEGEIADVDSRKLDIQSRKKR